MNAVSRLTAKELNLAARTVFAEAATEGLNGQMVVAQTMYDQLHHNIIGADGSGFGKTLDTGDSVRHLIRVARIYFFKHGVTPFLHGAGAP